MQVHSENKILFALGKKITESSLKIALGFFFLFILLAQSFSVFAFVQNGKHESISGQIGHIGFFAKTFIHPLVDKTEKNNFYLESEDQFIEEDDDYQEHSPETNCDHISQQYAVEELFHTHRLNVQYLRLHSLSHLQSRLPLFILHHNWKNYLS